MLQAWQQLFPGWYGGAEQYDAINYAPECRPELNQNRADAGSVLAPYCMFMFIGYIVKFSETIICARMKCNQRPFLTQRPCDAYKYVHQWTGSSLVKIMACPLFSAMPLPEQMITHYQFNLWEQTLMKFES